jgi:hypothetical protein
MILEFATFRQGVMPEAYAQIAKKPNCKSQLVPKSEKIPNLNANRASVR